MPVVVLGLIAVALSHLWVWTLKQILLKRNLYKVKVNPAHFAMNEQNFLMFGNSTIGVYNQNDPNIKPVLVETEREPEGVEYLIWLLFCIFTFHLARIWTVWFRAVFILPRRDE